jgi:GMP synthase-like glutamine amidotransferase
MIELDAGQPVPADPTAYAGIGMMGGYMSVNDPLPWIPPVQALVRGAVAARVPVIGHCLGGQMLARALGAPVTRAAQAEIGWIDVDVDTAAAADAATWFGGRTRFPVFQWHYDAFDLPAGATRLLTNRFNPNQAYTVDGIHIGMQCHVEMSTAMLDDWLRASSDELPAQSSATMHSEADVRAGVDARIDTLHGVASAVYTRWSRSLRH